MLRLTFILALAGAGLAQQAPLFIQMSDPQFGMYSENRDFVRETANFEWAVATANRLKPRFVVVTGDLVHKPGDPAQVAEYKRIAAKIDRGIPLYSVPGNHDVGNEPTAASLAAYREQFGRDYYTFRSGDIAAFVLNSALQKAPAKVPEEAARQEDWLRKELAKAKREGARNILVFQHHPLFLKDADEKEEYFNIPPETRKRLLSIFHEYGIRWVFTGHHHRNGEARDGDLRIVISGPVGKPLGGGKSGIRIVIADWDSRWLEIDN